MKKNILLAPIFFLGITAGAQVGILTETPQSTLDIRAKTANTTTGIAAVVSAEDGILAPRIASFGTINGTKDGQLVFLTANITGTGTVANPQYKKGFHYWNAPNTTWTPINTDTGGAATNDDWRLIGNAGTNSAINFIGTIDNQDFVVKRNNVFSGSIGTLSTSWGNNSFNTTATGLRNTAIGALTLTNNTTGSNNSAVGYNALTANTEGSNNVALGINSLQSNTIGVSNTAVGPYSLQDNTTGDSNVAVGGALNSNTTASVNTGIGAAALGNTTTGGANTAIGGSSLIQNITGIANTAVGASALNFNISGSNNTAVGQNALPSNTGSNNIGVGVQAGRFHTTGSFNLFLGDGTGVLVGTGGITNATAIGKNATVGASNSMVLGGTGADVVNVGIGVNVPTNTLHVKPSTAFDPMRVEGVKSSTATSDKVLVIDTNGVVKTALNSQSGFGGYLLANTAYTSAITKITSNEIYDLGNEYNPTTGIFTPATSGFYEYEVNVTCNNAGLGLLTSTRGIVGFTNATTNQWIGRNNFEANTDDRTYYYKGVANLVAGQGYYFGIAAPPLVTGNVVANPTGASGTGIGTYFSVKKIQ